MPKQSTRHSYKSRRERNAVACRRARQIGVFVAILIVLLIIRKWDDLYAYYSTYFNGL